MYILKPNLELYTSKSDDESMDFILLHATPLSQVCYEINWARLSIMVTIFNLNTKKGFALQDLRSSSDELNNNNMLVMSMPLNH